MPAVSYAPKRTPIRILSYQNVAQVRSCDKNRQETYFMGSNRSCSEKNVTETDRVLIVFFPNYRRSKISSSRRSSGESPGWGKFRRRVVRNNSDLFRLGNFPLPHHPKRTPPRLCFTSSFNLTLLKEKQKESF